MKFKNKQTNEVVEVKGYVQEFAYSHNSAWEKVKSMTKDKEPTVNEIKTK